MFHYEGVPYKKDLKTYLNSQDVWSHETIPTLFELKCDLSLTFSRGSFKEPKGWKSL